MANLNVEEPATMEQDDDTLLKVYSLPSGEQIWMTDTEKDGYEKGYFSLEELRGKRAAENAATGKGKKAGPSGLTSLLKNKQQDPKRPQLTDKEKADKKAATELLVQVVLDNLHFSGEVVHDRHWGEFIFRTISPSNHKAKDMTEGKEIPAYMRDGSYITQTTSFTHNPVCGKFENKNKKVVFKFAGAYTGPHQKSKIYNMMDQPREVTTQMVHEAVKPIINANDRNALNKLLSKLRANEIACAALELVCWPPSKVNFTVKTIKSKKRHEEGYEYNYNTYSGRAGRSNFSEYYGTNVSKVFNVRIANKGTYALLDDMQRVCPTKRGTCPETAAMKRRLGQTYNLIFDSDGVIMMSDYDKMFTKINGALGANSSDFKPLRGLPLCLYAHMGIPAKSLFVKDLHASSLISLLNGLNQANQAIPLMKGREILTNVAPAIVLHSAGLFCPTLETAADVAGVMKSTGELRGQGQIVARFSPWNGAITSLKVVTEKTSGAANRWSKDQHTGGTCYGAKFTTEEYRKQCALQVRTRFKSDSLNEFLEQGARKNLKQSIQAKKVNEAGEASESTISMKGNKFWFNESGKVFEADEEYMKMMEEEAVVIEKAHAEEFSRKRKALSQLESDLKHMKGFNPDF